MSESNLMNISKQIFSQEDSILGVFIAQSDHNGGSAIADSRRGSNLNVGVGRDRETRSETARRQAMGKQLPGLR